MRGADRIRDFSRRELDKSQAGSTPHCHFDFKVTVGGGACLLEFCTMKPNC